MKKKSWGPLNINICSHLIIKWLSRAVRFFNGSFACWCSPQTLLLSVLFQARRCNSEGISGFLSLIVSTITWVCCRGSTGVLFLVILLWLCASNNPTATLLFRSKTHFKDLQKKQIFVMSVFHCVIVMCSLMCEGFLFNLWSFESVALLSFQTWNSVRRRGRSCSQQWCVWCRCGL